MIGRRRFGGTIGLFLRAGNGVIAVNSPFVLHRAYALTARRRHVPMPFSTVAVRAETAAVARSENVEFRAVVA